MFSINTLVQLLKEKEGDIYHKKAYKEGKFKKTSFRNKFKEYLN